MEIKSTGGNRFLPNQPLLSYHSCSSSESIRKYIVLIENISISQNRSVEGKYFLYNVSFRGEFRLLQLWMKENKNLYTILIADKLEISVDGNEIQLNSSIKCTTNLSSNILTFTWTCIINNQSVVLLRYKNYNLTKYDEDERSILHNIEVKHDTLHFGLDLPMYVYKCYCEASYKVLETKYADRKDISFINYGNIESTTEFIMNRTDDYVRGLIVKIERLRSSLFEIWNVDFGNRTRITIPKNQIHDGKLFIEINESYIGNKLNMTISACTKISANCMNLKQYDIVYCDKKFTTKIYLQHIEYLYPFKPIAHYSSCSKTDKRLVFNPSVHNISRYTDGAYFKYEISIVIKFGFCQFWVPATKQLFSVLIANKPKVGIQEINMTTNYIYQCTTNLPAQISEFRWKLQIKNKWIRLSEDKKDYKQYTKVERFVLKYISMLNQTALKISSKLPINIYIFSCTVGFRVSGDFISDKQYVVLDLHDPIINRTEERIITMDNVGVRGIKVYLENVLNYLISHWNVSVKHDKWFTLPKKLSNNRQLFIPIDESLIKETIILRIKSCTYSEKRCITWKSKVLKYCEIEKVEYMLNTVKDLSIWKAGIPFASVHSCRKETLRNLQSMFNPSILYKYERVWIDWDHAYFVYKLYFSYEYIGFYQFLLVNKSNNAKDRSFFSIIIYNEIQLSVVPNYYDLNITNQCSSNLPGGMLTYKWQCSYEKASIPLKRSKYYGKNSQVFENLYLINSKTIYFGNDLPLMLYTCFCEVSFRLKGKKIKGQLQFIFDFRSLRLNEILANMVERPFAYWIFVMIFWYLFICLIFMMLVYTVSQHRKRQKTIQILRKLFVHKVKVNKKYIYKEYFLPIRDHENAIDIRMIAKLYNLLEAKHPDLINTLRARRRNPVVQIPVQNVVVEPIPIVFPAYRNRRHALQRWNTRPPDALETVNPFSRIPKMTLINTRIFPFNSDGSQTSSYTLRNTRTFPFNSDGSQTSSSEDTEISSILKESWLKVFVTQFLISESYLSYQSQKMIQLKENKIEGTSRSDFDNIPGNSKKQSGPVIATSDTIEKKPQINSKPIRKSSVAINNVPKKMQMTHWNSNLRKQRKTRGISYLNEEIKEMNDTDRIGTMIVDHLQKYTKIKIDKDAKNSVRRN